MKNLDVIYLLGAGRSGTTIMATVLGANNKIKSVGELHQILDHLVENKNCSCGKRLDACPFWERVVNQPSLNSNDLKKWQLMSNKKEQHRNIPLIMSINKSDRFYLHIHETILYAILRSLSKNVYLLDSSKYIARYLLLRKSKKVAVKGIYVVRDVRGVINSFKKKVQTSRSPISTIFYYNLINFFGQIICWSDKNVIKVKYEDFVENTNEELAKIYDHLELTNDMQINSNHEYQIPHIIGGNRMKANKTIVLKKDEKWKEVIPRTSQIIYYIMTLPFMLINKYKI